MSANTFLNTAILLFSFAGIKRPHSAIRVKSPIVFIETVLPPVLGPVMTRESYLSPSDTSMGTAFFGSSNGWRAFLSSITPREFIIGIVAFIL